MVSSAPEKAAEAKKEGKKAVHSSSFVQNIFRGNFIEVINFNESENDYNFAA